MAPSSLKRRRMLHNALRKFLIPTFILFCLATCMPIRTHIANALKKPAQSKGYTGGLIDDVRFIKCFRWYKTCDAVLERRAQHSEFVTWMRVRKELNEETLYSVDSGLFYHSYLYVHLCEGNKNCVSDLAIAKDRTSIPMQVLQDINAKLQSKDSSMFHRHDHHKSFWSRIFGGRRKRLSLQGEDWHYRRHGIWCKYSSTNKIDEGQLITNLQIFLGSGFVDPRPTWKTAVHEMNHDNRKNPTLISVSFQKNDKRLDSQSVSQNGVLNADDGKFKILQVSDLHAGTVIDRCESQLCTNEWKTQRFISRMIELEAPDLVVFTGDFINGPGTVDYQTAILKATECVISAKIPWAITWGTLDYSNYASEREIFNFIKSLPYNLNYLHAKQVQDASLITTTFALQLKRDDEIFGIVYILDSTNSENAVDFLKTAYENVSKNSDRNTLYSLAFQHAPIPEYRPSGSFPIIGSYNDKSPLDVPQVGIRKALDDFRIHAFSCGQEHENDCCLQSSDTSFGNDVWLCYGGHAGVADQYSAGESASNVRLFRIDDSLKEITTWKRNSLEPDSVYDYQFLFKDNP
ncbi:LAQU0S04e02366g1_1 [Lachancea quebecensis]|uniref:LAQU0S04e02366g1_1 n=1 Tax=Lachancea quebecensis TaxID=1654605 RepID=A0A0P1KQJ3_9SACH|nr:LAQU0S04e02366g1_1 [Lachancea quebecensis]